MNEQTFVKLVESILTKNVLIKDCGASKEDLMRYKEVKPIFSDSVRYRTLKTQIPGLILHFINLIFPDGKHKNFLYFLDQETIEILAYLQTEDTVYFNKIFKRCEEQKQDHIDNCINNFIYS